MIYLSFHPRQRDKATMVARVWKCLTRRNQYIFKFSTVIIINDNLPSDVGKIPRVYLHEQYILKISLDNIYLYFKIICHRMLVKMFRVYDQYIFKISTDNIYPYFKIIYHGMLVKFLGYIYMSNISFKFRRIIYILIFR